MSDQFFSKQNETMLQRLLYKDICRRTGADLSEKEATRLIKTVKHYMGEVSRVNGNQPVSVLNKEVLTTTISDYMMYLERNGSSMTRTTAVEKIDQGNGVIQQTQVYALDNIPASERSQTDVSNLFARLQSERLDSGKKQPSPPDFRLAVSEEGPVSMDVFQKIKEEREQEALRANSFLQQYQQKTNAKQAQGQASFAEAGSMFSQEKKRLEEEAENAFAEAERRKLEASISSRNTITNTNLPVQPDMRELLFGTQPLQRKNESAGNPTLATPSFIREPSGGLQQMIITPEPSTMAYKETELNLFLYSGDRDWVNNANESRYNFTVNFDGGSMPVSMRLNASSIAKFRNIVRIELIKAIMPAEGVDLVVSKSGASTYDSSLNMNILSFPYIQVRIPELDNNSYGTNEAVNASFGVLQYDANWQTDTTNTTNRGYLAMIPKFMKCQKVYQPTPLSTFQKLSFRFERPDGALVSTIPDTLTISSIYPTLAVNSTNFLGGLGTAVNGTVYKTDNTVDIDASAYYWIQTSTYFNRWTVQKGDRILMKNIVFTNAPTGNASAQVSDLLTVLQNDAGVYVVDVGYITGTGPSGAVFNDDFNKQGYANAILVRGRFEDPALTGGLLPSKLAGIADSYTSGKLSYFLSNNSVATGRLLNLTHQIQVSLRVIVREVDPTGILRTDNLF